MLHKSLRIFFLSRCSVAPTGIRLGEILVFSNSPGSKVGPTPPPYLMGSGASLPGNKAAGA